MRSVGMRELRQHLGQILQVVYQEGEEISITSYGKEIARLVPPRKTGTSNTAAELWSRIDQVAAKIGKPCPGDICGRCRSRGTGVTLVIDARACGDDAVHAALAFMENVRLVSWDNEYSECCPSRVATGAPD